MGRPHLTDGERTVEAAAELAFASGYANAADRTTLALLNALSRTRGELAAVRVATDAERAVLAEREKQRAKWGGDHDDVHGDGALSATASALAHPFAEDHVRSAPSWAWDLRDKHRDDPRRRLVIAAALCIAEIERLDRLEVTRG